MSYFKKIFTLRIIFSIINICAQDTTIVYYKIGKFNLSNKEQFKLKNIDRTNISEISIRAFCDDSGTIKNNEVLSLKRANTVKDLLLNFNFDNHLIKETLGNGELPLSELSYKNTEQQRYFNRRTEVIITYSTSKITDLLKNLKIGDKMVLQNILFEGGRTKLLPESFSTLEILSDFLKENKNFKISILGHICCDLEGRDGLDWDTGKRNLSVVRAKKIYDYLMEKGAVKNQLSYKGLKAEFPTGKEDKYDRRVEIKVLGK